MYRTYQFTRMVKGKPKQDLVMIFTPKNTDLDEVLHKIGLDYCMAQTGKKEFPDGLSLPQLIEHIKPEILASYGMTMVWPNDIAIQADNAAPIISPYELDAYRESVNKGYCQVKNVCRAAERIARRLEFQRTHDHPAISTWPPNIISTKAIVWADQYVNGNEPDLVKFFEKKLQEAKPRSNDNSRYPADAGTSNGGPVGQCAEQIPQ